MSNNSVDLSGYLIVAKAGTLPVGRGAVPLVEGWITTDLSPAGGKHPFAALGDPLEPLPGKVLLRAKGNAGQREIPCTRRPARRCRLTCASARQ